MPSPLSQGQEAGEVQIDQTSHCRLDVSTHTNTSPPGASPQSKCIAGLAPPSCRAEAAGEEGNGLIPCLLKSGLCLADPGQIRKAGRSSLSRDNWECVTKSPQCRLLAVGKA